MNTFLLKKPVGWWIKFEENIWAGPFDSENQAYKHARLQKKLSGPREYVFLKVMPWETKIVKIK